VQLLRLRSAVFGDEHRDFFVIIAFAHD
jgi:hypothetical protein